MNDNKFHYFTSSFANWQIHADKFKCVEAQRKADKGIAKSCNLYKVPLPIEAPYDINEYKPEVEGVEFLENIKY